MSDRAYFTDWTEDGRWRGYEVRSAHGKVVKRFQEESWREGRSDAWTRAGQLVDSLNGPPVQREAGLRAAGL